MMVLLPHWKGAGGSVVGDDWLVHHPLPHWCGTVHLHLSDNCPVTGGGEAARLPVGHVIVVTIGNMVRE